jgi:hypothetical protein
VWIGSKSASGAIKTTFFDLEAAAFVDSQET